MNPEIAAAVLLPDWPAPAIVRAVVTTRGLPGMSLAPHEQCNLGTRCGDRAEHVAANRAGLVHQLGLPAQPAWLRQVHGISVHSVDTGLAQDSEVAADAAYTRSAGHVCVVQTADCLPLLICSADGREIAAVHAGWRGLAAGVIEATLARFESPAAQLHAWLGPAIGASSYEVGAEVRDAFLRHDERAADAFVATRPQHWFCDLYQLARQRLGAAGVSSIHGGGFDTLTDDRFYSHRRNRPTGRFASLIWIADSLQPSQATHSLPASSGQLEGQPRASAPQVEPALFRRVLGSAFDCLPGPVRELHLARGEHRYGGRAQVRRGNNLLSRLCAWVTSLPPASEDAEVDVVIVTSAETEVWTRRFGGHCMRSRFRSVGGLLRERLGLVTFDFALTVQDDALCWQVRGVRALGLPLPARWFHAVWARESERDGAYRYEVHAALPLVGLLVHYAGWLRQRV